MEEAACKAPTQLVVAPETPSVYNLPWDLQVKPINKLQKAKCIQHK